MIASPAPTDQRAAVRPISFALDNGGSIGQQVMLPVRPEDLTKSEPARSTVHQSLGRTVQGWVDNFGEGLPTATISGHTGWLHKPGTNMDGFSSFEALNKLVVHDYQAAKQSAVDSGRNPASVKLLFIDLLDQFAWSVEPMQFVLRRSKSRPLLFQYNITLQAVSTSVDNPFMFVPFFGSIATGLTALDSAISGLLGFAGDVQNWVASAVSFVDRALAPIGAVVKTFVNLSARVFQAVSTTVRTIDNGIKFTANRLIGIAADMARVGTNIFRTFAVLSGLPSTLKSALSRVAGAFNEVLCIFNNSLRPRRTYDDYSGLYGASNCSSTTGGRPASIYVGTNAFDLMRPDRGPVTVDGVSLSSIGSLSRSDPVLSPLPIPEVERHLTNIVGGISV